MTPAKRLRAQILIELRRRKTAGERIWWCSVMRAGLVGVPDLHITYYGRSIWVEIKANQDRLTQIQAKRRDEIQAAIGVWFVARSVEDMINWLNVLSQGKDALLTLKQIEKQCRSVDEARLNLEMAKNEVKTLREEYDEAVESLKMLCRSEDDERPLLADKGDDDA